MKSQVDLPKDDLFILKAGLWASFLALPLSYALGWSPVPSAIAAGIIAICPSLVLEIDRPNGPPRKDLGSREARKAFDMLVLRLGNPAVRSRDSRC